MHTHTPIVWEPCGIDKLYARVCRVVVVVLHAEMTHPCRILCVCVYVKRKLYVFTPEPYRELSPLMLSESWKVSCTMPLINAYLLTPGSLKTTRSLWSHSLYIPYTDNILWNNSGGVFLVCFLNNNNSNSCTGTL